MVVDDDAHAYVRSSDGTRLSVRRFGPPDAPAVVLVHGFACTSDVWHEQVMALRGDHRVIVYDQRGHGASDLPRRQGYSVAATADDLDAVLTSSLRAGQKAVIAGHSMGGSTVLAWAGRHPRHCQENAAGAALISTSAGGFMPRLKRPLLQGVWSRALPRVLATTTRAASSRSVHRAAGGLISRRLVRMTVGDEADPCVGDLVYQLFAATPRQATAGWARCFISEIGWRHLDLDAMSVPVVVIAGRRDRLLSRRHASWMATAAPNLAGIVELDCGHFSILERPTEINDVLRTLVRSASW